LVLLPWKQEEKETVEQVDAGDVVGLKPKLIDFETLEKRNK